MHLVVHGSKLPLHQCLYIIDESIFKRADNFRVTVLFAVADASHPYRMIYARVGRLYQGRSFSVAVYLERVCCRQLPVPDEREDHVDAHVRVL